MRGRASGATLSVVVITLDSRCVTQDVSTSYNPLMKRTKDRWRPGQVRDAILGVLSQAAAPLSVMEICERINAAAGTVPRSSIQSYLSLNTPGLFAREDRGVYRVAGQRDLPFSASHTVDATPRAPFRFGRSTLFHAEALHWLDERPARSVHAVVTDPPYGLHEYSPDQQRKLRDRRGGVWRIPPSFDGHRRSPLPRFTTLTPVQLEALERFFYEWGRGLRPCLVPGAHVFVAASPLLSYIVANALSRSGLERRGEVIRLTTTMRGGDRPKGAHDVFPEVSVMPRSNWEPWVLFREPLEGRVQDNLRRWNTGALRRPCKDKPFGDVIQSAPTRRTERNLAPHPSLKPQAFLRQIVRAALPLGEGVVLDPFAGSGSTLAAAEWVGYGSIGLENDAEYFDLACDAIPKLAKYAPVTPSSQR